MYEMKYLENLCLKKEKNKIKFTDSFGDKNAFVANQIKMYLSIPFFPCMHQNSPQF